MSPRAAARPPAGRVVSLFVVFCLLLAGIGVRLLVLQLRDASAYAAMARDQRIRTIALPATRGAMFDREGVELALSLPAKAVYAHPHLVPDPEATAKELAGLLDIKRRDLTEKLARDGSFVYLARRVDAQTATRIQELRLPGIGFLDESMRSYPNGTLASQVVGFVGVDGQGLAGLELQHEERLAGTPGEMLVEMDPSGNRIPQGDDRLTPPVPGHDLVLTIDRDIQFYSQRALARAVRRNDAEGGTIVVMEVGTGEILAMASHPSFDLNEAGTANPDRIRNRAVTDVYEPGSVNKVITAAAALEEGVVGMQQVFPAVPDQIQVGPKLFQDAYEHPPLDMTLSDIVAKSSNVGSIMVAQQVGKERMDRYLRRFGFGRASGIDFPGEAAGILPPSNEWWETGIGTIPIGQGVAVTGLQMASVYQTIANRGVWVEPRLVRATVDASGAVHDRPAPERSRVVSAGTAASVGSMLAQAVATGTGTQAQIPGYWVAGKTGTARKPHPTMRGYSDDYIASFIGFAPAEDPRVVVAAMLDEPATIYGGVAAAPLFQEIARYTLAQMHVPTAVPPPSPPSALGS